jgi:ABC-type bacteriocin/lantibiotic exporter with double-glycine peptidase domain
VKRGINAALERLTGVNTRLSRLTSKTDFEGGDSGIKVCKALCQYFKMRISVPPPDIHHTIPDLVAEILYLSGLRYKEVELGGKWWTKDGGALLAYDAAGRPLALLPHVIRGYTLYNPETNLSCRLKAGEAALIRPRALAIFRSFVPKPMKFRELIHFMAGENIGKELGVIALFSLFTSIAAVIPPLVSAQIFDMIVPNTLRVMLFEVVAILLCFGIANIGFSVVTNISISRMITKIGIALEGGIWDRLLSLRLSFFARFSTGELLQKIQSIDRLKNLFSIFTVRTLIATLFSFVNIIVLVKLESRAAFYVLLLFLTLFVVYACISRKNFKYHRRYISLEGEASGFNHQALQGIQRIKVSHAEERIFRVWSEYEAEKQYLKGRIKIMENLNDAVYIFFQFGSTAMVFYLIFQTEGVAVGRFIAFISTFIMLQSATQRLLKTLNILPEAAALAWNIGPILKGESEHNTKKLIPKDMSGVLEVNNLSFRYSEFGKTTLKDISFRIEAGRSLGIIGPSGCGKSTLLKALLGFYPLAAGKIFYGGYDMDTIELRYLRKQLGVVLQTGFIPIGKLFDVITDNNALITRDAVMSALEKMDLLHKLDALPKGLDTPMARCDFSEAECQRLMAARAIVRPRPFIFFDEPTSRQDNITQQRILEHIYRIPATKIIIAQRLTTVKNCDSILVMNQGSIIAQKSFEEIVQSADFTSSY